MSQLHYDISVAIFGAIVGAVLTLIISKIQEKKFKLLWYARKENVIVNGATKFSDLQIKYMGKEVRSLTVITVVLWNHGKKTVKKKDFAIMPAVKLKNQNEVYSYGIIDSSNKESRANKFDIMYVESEQKINIDFDYIAKGQGVVFEILCDGTEDCELSLYSEVKEGLQIPQSPMKGNLKWSDPMIAIIQAVAFGVAMMASLVIETIITPWFRSRGVEQFEYAEIFFILFAGMATFIGLLYANDKKWIIPKELKRYFDN